MSKILCIYHGNCADGFGAAWAVRHALGSDSVEFHAGVYGKPPADVVGRDVVIVDFSYKLPALEAMIPQCKSLLILDHHKTAAEDLRSFLYPPPLDVWRAAAWEGRLSQSVRAKALFDMDRSGAGIAWDYFHPGEARPALIDHIEDRDLWRFNLPRTREIQAAVFSYPYDFEVWDLLMKTPMVDLAAEGMAIERKHHKDVAELVAVTRRTIMIGGYAVPAASLPYTLTSDAGNLMAEGEGFAACYWDTAEHRVFSLRSRPEGMDVSAIAASYGGGGHKNAAGFQVPRDS